MNINLDIKINNNYIDSFPVEFIDKLKTEIEIYYKTNKEQVDYFILADKNQLTKKHIIDYINNGNSIDNLINECGETLLFQMCRNRNKKMIKILIDNEANINHQNNDGHNLLDILLFNYNNYYSKDIYLIFKYLINKGIKISDNILIHIYEKYIKYKLYEKYGIKLINLLIKNNININNFFSNYYKENYYNSFEHEKYLILYKLILNNIDKLNIDNFKKLIHSKDINILYLILDKYPINRGHLTYILNIAYNKDHLIFNKIIKKSNYHSKLIMKTKRKNINYNNLKFKLTSL